MAELQALDRVHRLGQTRDVVITRYIIGDSFEKVRYRLLRCRTLAEIPLLGYDGASEEEIGVGKEVVRCRKAAYYEMRCHEGNDRGTCRSISVLFSRLISFGSV
jgi:hypothetical protein